MIERATQLHADLLTFHRGLSIQDGDERLDKHLTEAEYAARDKDFVRRIYEIGDAFYERGFRGPSIPIFAVIGPYAFASPNTLALAADRLREGIEAAKASRP